MILKSRFFEIVLIIMLELPPFVNGAITFPYVVGNSDPNYCPTEASVMATVSEDTDVDLA